MIHDSSCFAWYILYVNNLCLFVILILFGCTIITHDKSVSRFKWGTRETHRNVWSLKILSWMDWLYRGNSKQSLVLNQVNKSKIMQCICQIAIFAKYPALLGFIRELVSSLVISESRNPQTLTMKTRKIQY